MRGNVESLKVVHQMSEISEYVTVSIGIATVKPEKTMDSAGLIEKADTALYRAKNTGRNRVVVYDIRVFMSA
jgi:diguanylate cyclase (GGDEF)-like protein